MATDSMAAVDIDKLVDCLRQLSSEAKEFYLSNEVPTIDGPLSPLPFYRDYVSYNRPVIIKNAVKHWPAFRQWQDNSYFRKKCGDMEVTVAVTPNGLADSPLNDRFVMPEERVMQFGKFLDIIESPDLDETGIYYIQRQNSNLTEDFPNFLDLVEPHIPWATEAFGKPPDAVNFWLGDRRAVTSMHKDPYENIYCVVRGYKDIILQPPSDISWIPYKKFRPAIFKYDSSGDYHVENLDGDLVPWIDIDPVNPDLEKYPDYANSTQVKLRLEAGDALYLPSLWFHHLRQSQGCIAVNYWYDMEFDVKYNYFTLLNNIKELIKPTSSS